MKKIIDIFKNRDKKQKNTDIEGVNTLTESVKLEERKELEQTKRELEETKVKQQTTDPTKGGKTLSKGIPRIIDIIAPSALQVDFNHVQIGDKFFRTLFVAGYPKYVDANWLSPIINFDHTLLISMYYYPVDAREVLDKLRKKIAEMEATINIAIERQRVVDSDVQAALVDARILQEQLVKGVEKYFQFSFYVTISADTLEELNNITYQVESTLGSLSIITKKCTLEMEEAFQTTLPTCLDKIQVLRNMNTTAIASTFPFTSSDLTANEGILYGINKHNNSLVIFDRFTMENANMVVFATSGSGKSYLVKIEALRSMMFGTDIIIMDPENEYQNLAESVGGEYIKFSVNSEAKMNPFDLPIGRDEGEDVLGLKILSLHSLLKIMVGELNSSESAVLDRALIETYRLKGITNDPRTQTNTEPPLMEDLYKVLLAMDEQESRDIADKLERYIKGSLAGIFDQRTNIDLNNKFTAFSVQNIEGILRPIAMFIILDFIWTKVRNKLKKRILIFEEAWTLMRYPDSALFIYSLVKRARKYYLGVTVVSQDVQDFMSSEMGKPVISNSAIQVLLKQHPTTIDVVTDAFYLSQGERSFLLSANIGEGLFFAGTNHVAVKIQASVAENDIITTNPEEVLKLKAKREAEKERLKNIENKDIKEAKIINKYKNEDKGETKQDNSIGSKEIDLTSLNKKEVKSIIPEEE